MENLSVIELESVAQNDIEDLDELMHILNPNAEVTLERVRNVVESINTHLYIVRDMGHIVSCATLCICHTPEKVIGFVEAVVVKHAYRGRHLGRRLMETICEQSLSYGVQEIHLTSNPRRIEANSLYLSMGFARYETNCYHLSIK